MPINFLIPLVPFCLSHPPQKHTGETFPIPLDLICILYFSLFFAVGCKCWVVMNKKRMSHPSKMKKKQKLPSLPTPPYPLSPC
ncbi:hypothetical protein QBC40DRAFT_98901 [Triangularia verruculosa]|uniref:Uncharacterized protein n=1 Tax=Triangularia verruculosa TaxID=2587418 RepID=A0AAN6XVJ2_9PEZI|nr:hypothetical protein QBC40DRAFT_98901 [Triangularia verruculosa]